MIDVRKTDDLLRHELELLKKSTDDYWSFRGNAAREHSHAYFQYPAMMVPQMQGDLLRSVLKVDRNVNRVFDPFVGSGTSLTESMMKGLDFVGFDINPLAVLLCRAKTIPLFDKSIESKLAQLFERISLDNGCVIDSKFPNWNKWFRRGVAIRISRIRRAIVAEENLDVRRFYWVALAETVRLSSNSRTSTFKLHVREQEERETRVINPIEQFTSVVERNLRHLKSAKVELARMSLVSRGRYKGDVQVKLRDISKEREDRVEECDLLLTSPPYGDNATTIPYGQHSYLPLQWIDLDDIDSSVDRNAIRSTHGIDSRSLGGSKSISESDKTALRKMSGAYARTLRELRSQPTDRTARVTSFCRDLNRCIDPILSRLRKDAYMVWIVGNRSVGGRTVPLDRILSDMLTSRDSHLVARIRRTIPTKRMAVRNDIASTMGRETILVFRKG